QSYMGANYRASGMVFVASGAVEHARIVELVARDFAELSPGVAEAPQAARYVGGEMRVAEDLEQVHVTYAFPGVSNTEPDFFTAQAFTTALGGGMSSRLFPEAREHSGRCYSVCAF